MSKPRNPRISDAIVFVNHASHIMCAYQNNSDNAPSQGDLQRLGVLRQQLNSAAALAAQVIARMEGRIEGQRKQH